MTSQELTRQILHRINRFKYVIIICALIPAVLLFWYASKKPVVYSVRSTVFPLTAGAENNSSSSKLTDLIGGSNTKSLSEEANVNIEEVGRSKKTREATVMHRLPEYNNKTIAEILINEYNKHLSFRARAIDVPKSDTDLMIQGSELLKTQYTLTVNKNKLLEIVVSCTDQKLITPLSYVLIDNVSQFYKELKIKKAKFDFDFTAAKVDSFENVLDKYDRQRIQLNNTTMFVPKEKLQYSIPKENVENDKLRVLAQRNGAASNREEALWRLQKVTPIIEILDKPEPPYDVAAPSKIMYAAAGFVIGCLLFAFIFIAGLLYRFANQQVQTLLADKPVDNNTSITA